MPRAEVLGCELASHGVAQVIVDHAGVDCMAVALTVQVLEQVLSRQGEHTRVTVRRGVIAHESHAIARRQSYGLSELLETAHQFQRPRIEGPCAIWSAKCQPKQGRAWHTDAVVLSAGLLRDSVVLCRRWYLRPWPSMQGRSVASGADPPGTMRGPLHYASVARSPGKTQRAQRDPPVPMCSETSAFGNLESKGSIHSCQQ